MKELKDKLLDRLGDVLVEAVQSLSVEYYRDVVMAPELDGRVRVLGLTLRQISLLSTFYENMTGKRADTIGKE